jgi:hypothetical protein
MDARTVCDDAEMGEIFLLPGFEYRPLDRPAHSQSLSLLCYLDGK